MRKQNYEIPLCEPVKLEFESAVLAFSDPLDPSAFGSTGEPGNDLEILEQISF